MSFVKSLVAERAKEQPSDSAHGTESQLLAASKRKHDLKSAYLVFQSLSELLEEGYRFDDESAEAYLLDLKKALRKMEGLIQAEEDSRR